MRNRSSLSDEKGKATLMQSKKSGGKRRKHGVPEKATRLDEGNVSNLTAFTQCPAD